LLNELFTHYKRYVYEIRMLMIHQFRFIVVLALFIVIATGCSEDEPVYDVPPEFQTYVDRFIVEAAKYGQDIDFSDTGLSIQFRDAVDQETGGVCLGNHQIEIEKFFWDDLSEFDKEGLIFHELGHCELGRPHRNDKLPNGEWASRMRGSPIPDGDNAVINYAGSRLEYYRQEFFTNTSTAIPSWASRSASINDAFDRVEVDLIENQETFDEAYLGLSQGDFEIDIIMNSGTSEGFVGVQFMGSSNDDRIRIGYTREGLFAIDSGNLVWGLMFLRENYSLLQSGDNRLTIRREGEIYNVFVNDVFVYWFDYLTPFRETVSSLNAGTLGTPEYKSVSIQSLN